MKCVCVWFLFFCLYNFFIIIFFFSRDTRKPTGALSAVGEFTLSIVQIKTETQHKLIARPPLSSFTVVQPEHLR